MTEVAKRIGAFTLKLLVSGVLLALLFSKINRAELENILARAHLGYAALAILVYVVGQIFSAWRWKLLLEPLESRVGLARITALYYLGMFFNLFLPTTIGGDAVKLFYISREAGGFTRGAISILMDRNLGLMTLLLLAYGVTIFYGIKLPQLPLLPLLTLMLAGFLLINLTLFNEQTFSLLDRLLNRWRGAKLYQKIEVGHDALRTYRRNPQSVLAALLLSLIFDLALMVCNYLNALAIGHPVELKYFFIFIPIISIVTMLPISLYGLGLREYSFILLFGQVGVSREPALLIAILALIVPAIASLPGGVAYLLVTRRSASSASVTAGAVQRDDQATANAEAATSRGLHSK